MKKDLRGTLAMMLAVMMLFSLVPTMAFAETKANQSIYSGIQPKLKMNLSPIGATTTYKLGANITGVLDSTTGVLTVSGTGRMNNYTNIKSPLYSKKIKSITINQGVTSIGDFVFQGTSSSVLNSVTIPDSVTSIGISSFQNNFALTSIIIGSSVTSIGNGSFSGCEKLTSVSIPASLKSIGDGSFMGCKNLSLINVDPSNSSYVNLDGVLFNKALTSLIVYPAKKNGTSYIIPDSVTSIMPYAFCYCIELTSVNIPNSVNNIGNYSFYGCTGLTSIILPNAVKSIGNSAFSSCSKLTSINNLYNNAAKQAIGTAAFNTKATGTKTTMAYSINTNFTKAVKDAGYSVLLVTATASTVTAPIKVLYNVGEPLDLTGGSVKTTFNNGVSEIRALTINMISGYNANISGTQVLTVTLFGLKSTFNVSVNQKILESISITNAPNKTAYIEGENFDSTGMILTATYLDGTSTNVYGMVDNGNNLVEGTNNVTISYVENGITKTAIQPITVTTKELASIAITTTPAKTSYLEGENFDITGMIVTATYNNGTTAIITGTVTNGNNLIAGTNSITISYTETGITKTTAQVITVVAKQLSSIAITTAPSQTAYTEGEDFDTTGMIVTATYNNGTTAIITGTVTNGNNLTAGTNSITISYTENGITKTITQPITVNNKELTSITITTVPTKTVYIEGQNFDATGMVVTATYTDGSTSVVTGLVTNGTALVNGATCVTVSYTKDSITKTVTQTITVTAKSLESIAIATAPTKTVYFEGENFDATGMVVTASYNNGKTAIVTSTIDSGENLTTEMNSVTISYIENGIKKTTTQSITVIAKELDSIVITTAPSKVIYVEGENFDATEMIVSATYTNGSTNIVTGIVTNGNSLTKGTTSVTVSYTENGIAKITTQPITVVPKEKVLTSITITTTPSKTTYFEGENFDLTGMVVTATYGDGNTATVIATVENGKNLVVGTNSITISYTEDGVTKTTIQTITVTEKTLSSIAITTAPTKTVYFEGEKFDATGMVVTATYNNGKTAIITGTVANGNNLTAGTNSMIISYVENGITKTATQQITVIAKELASIAITTAPTKTTYIEGEKFDPMGMVVTATYNDGTTAIVTGNVTNGDYLVANYVTISYTAGGITKTATQALSVTPKTLSSIAITTAPTKIVYVEGENFDATGMIVSATYTDGSTSIVKGTITSGNSLKKGAIAVTVSYTKNGITKLAIQPITVTAKTLTSIAITTAPNKTSYVEGEDFDTTGMIITATYMNGTTAEVTGTVVDGNNLTIGKNSVTISYLENGIKNTTTQPITVTTKELTSIAITTDSTKKAYFEGESFDASGMVVTATYNNGTTAEVTGTVANGNNLTVGTNSVMISYIENGITKTITQPITIVPIANATTTSYALGTNVIGKFDAITGVLTVFGTGAMKEDLSTSPIDAIRKSIKYVVVENGVTTIGKCAFYNCPNLTAVVIPDSVTVIGNMAFSSDKSLSSITLGNSITSLGDHTFQWCSSLTTITFPNTLTTIGAGAFGDCTGLTSLDLPNSVTTIGNFAFSNSGLTSMVIPDSVASLGEYCFSSCKDIKSVILPSGIKIVRKGTFDGCNSLSSVTIPNGIISLGDNAFYYCQNLPSIILPESITEFGKKCFYQCPNLKSITNLAKTRQKISTDAFDTFAKGNLKASGTSYNYFFKEAITKEGYTWEETLYDEMVYNLGPSITGKIDKDGTLTVSGTGEMTNFTSQYPIFYRNNLIKKIIINEGITNIGDYAFYACAYGTRLSSIVIADSVTKINQHAFDNVDPDLVVIGKSVATIDTEAFANCGINTIKNLYTGSQTLGYMAFYQADNNFRDFKSTAYMYPENTAFKGAVNAKFNISYLTDSLTSLAVTTAPAKTVYLEGENFDSTGMVVTVTYNDGTTAIVDGIVTNGNNLSDETTSVTLSYTEDGITKTTTQPITVVAKELVSIAITTAPAKTSYIVGQNFDSNGMIVTATYSDGSTAVVTGVITDGTALANGATFVTVSYTKNDMTKTAMQPITVNAKQLSSITITNAPTKITYNEGENFDPTGMVVTATYNTGTTAIVTGTVADGNNLTAGMKSVTISYIEDGITKTVTQPITVETKKLTSIAITTAPTKTAYIEGENFDATGMVITAAFNNGTTAVILGSVTDGNNLAVGTTSVAISYTQDGIIKTINQPITVTGKSISNTLLIDCTEGNNLFVPFRVIDTKNLKDTIFSLKYDVANLELVDLVSQTKAIEITPGIVDGSEIEILSYTPGEIRFKVNKTVASGKTWSGTVNIFKFKAKITGKTSVVAGYN